MIFIMKKNKEITSIIMYLQIKKKPRKQNEKTSEAEGAKSLLTCENNKK